MIGSMNTQVNQRLNSRQALPRRSLPSAIADRLRDKILRGELREGEQLRQHALAEEFEVSRIPVREAFRQLEGEGLITIIEHRGAVVSALSPDDIQEYFDIRAALECAILRHAVPSLTEDDLARAEKILEEYEAALGDEADFDVWGELHWRFHSTLYASAGRARFMSLIQTINNHADRYIRLHILFSRNAHRHAKDEHRALLELCRKRETDAASRLLDEHITKAGREMKEFIEREQA
ncbi:MAG TPA: GntR family transcriptional regulator [Blastocatellia bacterium]|nr:GntR family transcriptional regulator [Blastocatellia bacterium]